MIREGARWPLAAAGLAAAAIICIGVTAAAQPPKTPTDEQKAREAFQAGKFEEALKSLQAAARGNPAMAPPRVVLSRWFLEAGQGQQARVLLESAAVEDPDHPDVYLTNASYALREGRITDVIVNCQVALEKAALPRWDPELRKRYQREARLGLVEGYTARGNIPAAREHLRAVIEGDPTNPQLRRQMARLAFQGKDPDSALAEFGIAFKHDPAGDPPELGLALLWASRLDFPKADEWFTKAAQAHGGLARVQVEFARYLLARGRLDTAKAHVAAAQRIDPNGRETRAVAGLVARYEKNYPAATVLFEALVRDHPTYAFATGNLALVLAESADMNQKRRAIDLAELYIKQNPQAADGYAVLGYCLYKNGRPADAEKALAVATSAGQATPDTAYYAALVLNDRGKPDEALKLLKAAIDSQDAFVFRKEAEALLSALDAKLKKP